MTFDLANNKMEVHNNYAEPWKVTLVDTGLNTMTGGRVKRIQPYIGDEPFMLTYGDGVCNVDLKGLVEFHKSHGKRLPSRPSASTSRRACWTLARTIPSAPSARRQHPTVPSLTAVLWC